MPWLIESSCMRSFDLCIIRTRPHLWSTSVAGCPEPGSAWFAHLLGVVQIQSPRPYESPEPGSSGPGPPSLAASLQDERHGARHGSLGVVPLAQPVLDAADHLLHLNAELGEAGCPLGGGVAAR